MRHATSYSTTRFGDSGILPKTAMKSRKYSRVAEEIFPGTAVPGIILTPTWPVSMTAQNSDLRTGARMPGRRIKETAVSVCVPGEWHPGAADGAAGRSASSREGRAHCHWLVGLQREIRLADVAQFLHYQVYPWVNVSPKSGRSGTQKLGISDTIIPAHQPQGRALALAPTFLHASRTSHHP